MATSKSSKRRDRAKVVSHATAARTGSVPARLSAIAGAIATQPTITVDAGTPTRKTYGPDHHHHYHHPGGVPLRADVRPTGLGGRLETESEGVSDSQSWSQDHSQSQAQQRPAAVSRSYSGVPRSSIDDDNGEGDQDLTSPTTDLGELDYSDNEQSDRDHVEDDDDNSNGNGSGSGSGSGNGIDPARSHHARPGSSGNFYANPLQRSNSTPALGPPPLNAFAPPFYNRPPTPLPPSPSLTSLLRPSFSSRPTTPDDSESEAVGNGTAGEGSATEAVVAKSARNARTVPRASPKVPTYEYYGFVLYLTSGLCFLMYLLWSYLPSPFLHQLGIYYYPNRWWSLAVPAFLVMLLLYIYVALAAYNTEYLTPPIGSLMNVVDEAANVAAVHDRGGKESVSSMGKSRKHAKAAAKLGGVSNEKNMVASTSLIQASSTWKEVWNHGTDAVMDIPLAAVNEILYGDG